MPEHGKLAPARGDGHAILSDGKPGKRWIEGENTRGRARQLRRSHEAASGYFLNCFLAAIMRTAAKN